MSSCPAEIPAEIPKFRNSGDIPGGLIHSNPPFFHDENFTDENFTDGNFTDENFTDGNFRENIRKNVRISAVIYSAKPVSAERRNFDRKISNVKFPIIFRKNVRKNVRPIFRKTFGCRKTAKFLGPKYLNIGRQNWFTTLNFLRTQLIRLFIMNVHYKKMK